MITMQDVAIAAGVSIGSVDRALHGRGEISERTKRLILEKADELGYTPNRVAQALARKSAIHIGVVVETRNSETKFWRDIRAGIDSAAQELQGGGLEVSWHNVNKDPRQQTTVLGRLLEQKKIKGIALAVTDPNAIKEVINRAVDQNIAVMTFTMDAPLSKRMWFIGQDFTLAGRVAGELMGQFVGGRGQVAIVTGFHSTPGQRQRLSGFSEEVRAYYPEIEIVGIWENHNRPEKAYTITSEILHVRPDLKGIYITAAGAFGAARAIKQMKRENEVKLICFDIVDETVDYIKQGVIQASIGQNPFFQGQTVVETLYDYLVNRRLPKQQCMFMSNDVICRANIDHYLPKYFKVP
ncbi:MAG TPA: LacI family DNA-binding transcriptional regulator [Methanomassiliicoccales archaeon]|nr:LacI family DNA-binding transcriptional regulator [Methanomassiliicoccales archaeon]